MLDPFAGDVAGDRRVVALATDLVDFVDIDNAALSLFFVVPRSLVELENDVLDILAHIASLGEGGGVGDGEGDREQLGECLRQQSLTGAGRPDQHDVGLMQLDIGLCLVGKVDALVVVVDRDRQLLLRLFLANHVFVEQSLDFFGFGQRRILLLLQHPVLGDDVEADVNTLIADEDRGASDELFHLSLALIAERASKDLVAAFFLRHESSRIQGFGQAMG